jgi:hypothetical protein
METNQQQARGSRIFSFIRVHFKRSCLVVCALLQRRRSKKDGCLAHPRLALQNKGGALSDKIPLAARELLNAYRLGIGASSEPSPTDKVVVHPEMCHLVEAVIFICMQYRPDEAQLSYLQQIDEKNPCPDDNISHHPLFICHAPFLPLAVIPNATRGGGAQVKRSPLHVPSSWHQKPSRTVDSSGGLRSGMR